ncbi:MAG TPA: hypothetical protein VK014_16680 [Cyclobacteriaceae bacterium]|nr:hypothetical protein [Cyclobacteriaceae bacterium]
MANEKKTARSPQDEKNLLEWIVFSLSLLMIVSILGYLIYHASIYEPGSPDLNITYVHDPSEHAPHRYFLRIKNDGLETAEEVQIEMVLEQEGGVLEVAAMSLPYLPKLSAREGWVVFSKDPAMADTLYARVVSYKKP